MANEILVIDDDTRLSAMLAEYLTSAGYSVRTAANGSSGLQEIQRRPPDAVVLDVMLPDFDGFEVCRKIRAKSSVPVIMLTARGEETDRIVGLEIGADDYLAKPFSPRELVARLKAILRRTRFSVQQAELLRFGSLEIDRDRRVVDLEGKEANLTAYQFSLLTALAENAGRVLSRDKLMELVKGDELEAFDRSIDVHISRIRAAIERDPKHPRRILTIRGSGYLFARNQDDDRQQ
jgi:two-component system phosphate regulon response regulator OmpR